MVKIKYKFKDILDPSVITKLCEKDTTEIATLTHYLHNSKNGVSKSYKRVATEYVKELIGRKYEDESVSNEVAEEALQYLLFNTSKNIPFPSPKSPSFKFIDLFAGVGGFRLALQNLNGKCIYTSEWDKNA